MRFRIASEQAVLVYLGEEIGLAAHQRVVGLLRLLEAERPDWLRNVQPAYCSLLVCFDPFQIDHARVERALLSYAPRAEAFTVRKPRRIDVPVCYGGEYGPDLEEVAGLRGLTRDRVVELHSGEIYRAYFLGFAPGFAYLGDLREELATPRLATPRRKVAPGSVAIADRQTAIYPFATPGGWRLLGRTPLAAFSAERAPMELISVGDEVRFFSISPDDFITWAAA